MGTKRRIVDASSRDIDVFDVAAVSDKLSQSVAACSP
jgi:hypothetical protein